MKYLLLFLLCASCAHMPTMTSSERCLSRCYNDNLRCLDGCGEWGHLCKDMVYFQLEADCEKAKVECIVECEDE